MLSDRLAMAGRFTGRLILTVVLLCVAVAEGAVRFRSQSAHNQIVVEDKSGYRMLRFNGSMETRLLIANPLLGHFEYTDYFQMPLLWNPKAKRVLVMGLGGGSTQRAFQGYYPTVHVDTVELDPAVAKVAKEWFGVKETKTHTIHISDGRGYLRRNKNRKYEAIMMDAYSSNTYGSFIPYHLATKEFFQLAAEDLTANGVLAYNVIGTYQEWRADIVGSMYRTMKTVFPHVYHFPAGFAKYCVAGREGECRRLNERHTARTGGFTAQGAAEDAGLFWATIGAYSGQCTAKRGAVAGAHR